MIGCWQIAAMREALAKAKEEQERLEREEEERIQRIEEAKRQREEEVGTEIEWPMSREYW